MKEIQEVYTESFNNKLSESDYYLISSRRNKEEILISFFSNWYHDSSIDYPQLVSENKEMRQICLVNPDGVIKDYKALGQNIPIINKKEELLSVNEVGGHSLISVDLIKKHWLEITKPYMTLVTEKGFLDYSSIAGKYLKRFARADYRTSIFDRDGYQCRICGSSPDDSVHVRLEIHHIKPWEEGGLSTPENLITLCATCHDGAKCLDRATLYKKVGVRLQSDKFHLLPLPQVHSQRDYMKHFYVQHNAVTFRIRNKERLAKLFSAL